MADLIKKIKIKKQDGTFTDYIPIGAESKNIVMKNGLSVEEDLKGEKYKTKEGESFSIPYWYNVKDFKIYGKLQQNGTPSLNNKIELQYFKNNCQVNVNDEVYDINLDSIKLAKIGQYQDYLYKKDNEWYLHKETSNYIFTGTDEDNYDLVSDGTNTLGVNLIIKKQLSVAFKKLDIKYIYSNYFEGIQGIQDEEHIYITQASAYKDGWKGNVRIYIDHSRLSGYSSSLSNSEKIALVKTWLQNHPLEVVYILPDPEEIKITNSFLINQLETIFKNNEDSEISYFSISSNNLSFWLEMSYYMSSISGKIKKNVDDIEINKNEIIDSMPISSLELDTILSEDISPESYNGIIHDYPQGMCYVEENNSILVSLRNAASLDDYVRLVEYSLTTGEIIRQAYLILYHSNSLSYRKDTRQIYSANCSQVIEGGGGTESNNGITVINYDNLTIEKTIELVNLPENHRIRNAYYDNNHKILYGGDSFDIFEIDEDTSTITKTISLDKTGINVVTNQTLKRQGDYFLGLFMSYFLVWNLKGELIKICSFKREMNNIHLGEPEDFDFNKDGNVIMSTAKKRSPRIENRAIDVFIFNYLKNITHGYVPGIGGAGSSIVDIYVNNTSNSAKSLGSSTYPYKTLQEAFNFARKNPIGTTIHVQGNNYDYSYGHTIPFAYLIFESDVTIDGLELDFCNIIGYTANQNISVIINGMYAQSSILHLYGNTSSNNMIFRPLTKDSSLRGYNHCAYTNDGKLYASHITFEGSNGEENNVRITAGGEATFSNCIFNNYEGANALIGSNVATILLYNNTFAVPTSTTQHNIYMTGGSLLIKRNAVMSKNDIALYDQAQVFPTSLYADSTELVGNGYEGKVCDYDSHYNTISLILKSPSTNSHYTEFEMPLTSPSSQVIWTANVSFLQNDTSYIGMITFKKENNAINIEYNRTLLINNTTGAITYKNYSSSETQSNFIQVIGFKYINK